MTSPNRRDAGFTLIEVLVVLVILGLAIGLVAARGPARSPGLDARAAAEQIARALRLARSQAIATNAPTAFTLDTAGRIFQVGGAPPQALAPTVALGMTAMAEPTVAGQARIVFAPDGGSTGGTIRVGTGGRTLTVAADWLSGRVTVK